MTVDALNHYNRGEFDADAEALRERRVVGAIEAARLTRAAHFGVMLSQDPRGEMRHYSARIAVLCRTARVEAEALLILLSFLERGAEPQTEDPFVHEVTSADTFAELSERYRVEPETLIRANLALTPPAFLFVGARLQVPGNLTYVVRPGDSLARIAGELTQYVQCFDPSAEVTSGELMRRNRLASRRLGAGRALAFPLALPE